MLTAIFAIVILGAILYLIETLVPMAPPFKIILRVVIVLAIVFYLLRAAGMVTP